MRNLKVGNIAFWPYSGGSGRTYLAAKILKINRNDDYPGKGYVSTEGFGGWFKPAFCLTPKPGVTLYAKIQELEEDHRRAEKRLLAGKDFALSQLVPRHIQNAPATR